MRGSGTPSAWGKGLLAAFGLFVAGVLVMVYIAASQRVDLVTDRYYEQSLQYQQRIDARSRTSGATDVSVRNLPGAIELEFPRAARPDPAGGMLALYRPSDRRSDVTVEIRTDTAGRQRVATAALEPGLWRVKVEWKAGGLMRYHEEPVLIR